MSQNPWTLYDARDDETYVFERNPTAVGALTRSRNVRQQGKSMPTGQPILWEGQPQLATWSFSGFTESPAEYAALERWFEKTSRAIRVTDDHGHARHVLLVSFTEQRLTSGDHHRLWTLGCLVLDAATLSNMSG